MAEAEKSEREKLLERIPAPDRRSEPRPEVPGAEPGFLTGLGAGIDLLAAECRAEACAAACSLALCAAPPPPVPPLLPVFPPVPAKA